MSLMTPFAGKSRTAGWHERVVMANFSHHYSLPGFPMYSDFIVPFSR
ncbi:hypothetical protein J2751_002470 [Halorubrum alkaliphilum]|uniref:Uncharacterized protein n=1 Tax=Halorubrum alkaliphilum TaxID=261290 RepID=A0A8T4GFZ7_9EURY|nr:hypothetical protein [Halorubrum alkaliphilum]